MKRTHKHFSCIVVGLAAFCCFNPGPHGLVSAQSRASTTVVVTFPPRTGADILTRAVAEHIGRTHGTTMMVENSSPAAGPDAVAHAPPDGSVLLVINNNFEVDRHFRKLDLDPLTDLEPVCKLATAQALVVVSAASPYHKLSDLVAASQDNVLAVIMAAAPASVAHLGLEALKRATRANMTFLPVMGAVSAAGATPQLQAVLDGQASVSIQTYQNSLPHLNSGKLRALAVTTRERLEALSTVPPVAEGGFDYDLAFWDGVFAPAKTPKEKTTQLAAWFTEALNDPEVRSKIGDQAFIPTPICGDEFIATIRKEQDQFGSLIHEANIKP
jgi:tripartite-type tricarboxylate transporter receptor subunit TctC